jgi:DNA-binding LacI/PurR family transcriptional regulator
VTEPQSAPPSMREVAALAGVSHQTVSRVINGHANIRPQTRERVLRVIEEVGYRPNSAARALATRRTKRIGVVVDSAIKFGPNATLRGVEESARAAGYSVSSVTVGEDRSVSANAAVDHLLAQGIDAVCIIAPRSSSVDLIRTRISTLPAIAVTSNPETELLTASVDQLLGAKLAVEHLVGLGHRDIAHVAGPMDWLDAQGRARGWRAVLDDAGLTVRDPLVGDWTADSGYALATSAEWPTSVTAVFCANDQMALGLLHGLAEKGVRVPDDISIVGFDDLPEARHFTPPLTTVRQDFHRLGQRTVDALVAAIEGREAPQRTLIDPELVVRNSTAPA